MRVVAARRRSGRACNRRYDVIVTSNKTVGQPTITRAVRSWRTASSLRRPPARSTEKERQQERLPAAQGKRG